MTKKRIIANVCAILIIVLIISFSYFRQREINKYLNNYNPEKLNVSYDEENRVLSIDDEKYNVVEMKVYLGKVNRIYAYADKKGNNHIVLYKSYINDELLSGYVDDKNVLFVKEGVSIYDYYLYYYGITHKRNDKEYYNKYCIINGEVKAFNDNINRDKVMLKELLLNNAIIRDGSSLKEHYYGSVEMYFYGDNSNLQEDVKISIEIYLDGGKYYYCYDYNIEDDKKITLYEINSRLFDID